MTGRRSAAIALISGASAAFGHAPFHVIPLSLLGFAGLFWIVAKYGRDARSGAWLAWLGGTAYFAVTLHWIVEPFLVDAARHGWMAPFALVLLAGGLALFWALAGLLAARIGAGPARRGLALAVLLALAEMARGYVLSGFPWGLPGYVWIDTGIASGAALVGPYGLTLFTCLVAALPVIAWRWWAGAVPVAFLAVLSYVDVTLPSPSETLGHVRLVQPNAPQDEKWDPEKANGFVARQIAFTAAPKGEVDLVVWPETALPYRLGVAGPVLDAVAEAARGVPVVFGINRRAGAQNRNALVFLDEAGGVADVYDKVRLVPFGEFIPFGQLAELVGLRSFAARDGYGFSPGDAVRAIDTPLGRALPLICYEAIFPQHARALGTRPDYLLQITNDAWFGAFSGPFQHLDQARFRAIEQGLPLVRVANTGVSAVIDPRGQVVDRLNLNEAGFLDVAVPTGVAPTLYGRAGDFPVFILCMLMLAVILVAARRNAIAKHSATR